MAPDGGHSENNGQKPQFGVGEHADFMQGQNPQPTGRIPSGDPGAVTQQGMPVVPSAPRVPEPPATKMHKHPTEPHTIVVEPGGLGGPLGPNVEIPTPEYQSDISKFKTDVMPAVKPPKPNGVSQQASQTPKKW